METHAQRTLDIFRQASALLENDHFVYTNGDHGSGWIAKDRVLPFPRLLNELGAMLADAARSLQPEVLCAPAVGGLAVAQWVALHLEVPIVFTERHVTSENIGHIKQPFQLKRGFQEWIADRRVLVVDDVVSTGFSVRESMKALGGVGNVIGVATLISRGNVDAAGLGVDHFVYLAEVRIPSWPEADCPAEIMERQVNTRYAHGAEYVLGRRG